MNNGVKILVALHKKYDVPVDDLYLPLHVGAEGKDDLGFTKDNDGDNISLKNPNFCELTGMYWAWKNLDEDYVGLVHYRRYFGGDLNFEVGGKIKKILSKKQLECLLKEVDVVVPKKRNYLIETLYSHYDHTMYIEPLDCAGEIIREKHPEYYKEFELLKKRKSAHMFNMFIMKKNLFNKYCEWLFDVLFELEKRVDVSLYDAFHARFYGRVSELLLDVWLNTNKIRYKEVNLQNIERVNWGKKIFCFLKAKFGKEKYEKSF